MCLRIYLNRSSLASEGIPYNQKADVVGRSCRSLNMCCCREAAAPPEEQIQLGALPSAIVAVREACSPCPSTNMPPLLLQLLQKPLQQLTSYAQS